MFTQKDLNLQQTLLEILKDYDMSFTYQPNKQK